MDLLGETSRALGGYSVPFCLPEMRSRMASNSTTADDNEIHLMHAQVLQQVEGRSHNVEFRLFVRQESAAAPDRAAPGAREGSGPAGNRVHGDRFRSPLPPGRPSIGDSHHCPSTATEVSLTTVTWRTVVTASKIGWELGPKWARSAGARKCPPRRGGPTSPSQALCFHVHGCAPRA